MEKMVERKYEVIATVWDSELEKQVKVVAGKFTEFVNAKLFADAYEKHYSTKVDIAEYRNISYERITSKGV